MKESHDYDFIVIGSGFGVSVSACRLSEKGYKVAVLEMGKRWKPEDFPKTLDLFIKERHQRLRCAVSPSKTGAAGGDHYVNGGICNPIGNRRTNRVDVVSDEITFGNCVAVSQRKLL